LHAQLVTQRGGGWEGVPPKAGPGFAIGEGKFDVEPDPAEEGLVEVLPKIGGEDGEASEGL